jgi:tetratricopeptide (TPR) repeat protein
MALRIGILLFLLSLAGSGYAQCTAPTAIAVRGRVLAPGESFDSYHEVLLFDEARLVAWGYTNSTGEYYIPPQTPGKYSIVVRIEHFKEYRGRVDLDGCDVVVHHFVYMEPEEEPIPKVILDFTGEVNEVVDVSELKRQFPQRAVNEFEKARTERLRVQTDAARKRLEKLLREYPDFYEARNALGSVYLEAKEFRDAEAQYNKARELRPHSAAPWVSLGSLYVQEADAASDTGGKGKDPSNVLVFSSDVGVILDDAKGVLVQAIKIKPDASFAYYLLGIAEWWSGDYSKGEALLRKSMEVEPKLRWARLALANLHMERKNYKEALADLDTYLVDYKKVSNIAEVKQVREKVAAALAKNTP